MQAIFNFSYNFDSICLCFPHVCACVCDIKIYTGSSGSVDEVTGGAEGARLAVTQRATGIGRWHHRVCDPAGGTRSRDMRCFTQDRERTDPTGPTPKVPPSSLTPPPPPGPDYLGVRGEKKTDTSNIGKTQVWAAATSATTRPHPKLSLCSSTQPRLNPPCTLLLVRHVTRCSVTYIILKLPLPFPKPAFHDCRQWELRLCCSLFVFHL